VNATLVIIVIMQVAQYTLLVAIFQQVKKLNEDRRQQ